MSVFLCRWPNGDFSIVSAESESEAVELLDEIGNAEGCSLVPVPKFMAHFQLGEDGTFELEGFAEATENQIWEEYPILDEALQRIFKEIQDSGLTSEQMQVIAEAVAMERERVKEIPAEEPEMEQQAEEVLRKFNPKGKPN